MARGSLFGWSYPPGCSGPPSYEVEDPSELQEEVLALLEDGGMPEHYSDLIMEIIIAWEKREAGDPPENKYWLDEHRREAGDVIFEDGPIGLEREAEEGESRGA